MKFKAIVATLLLMSSIVFSQVSVNISEGNPIDSVIATYNFCMPIPVRADNYVMLQCKDKDGQMIYMRVREDLFHGKITIILIPDQNLGPITEEKVYNWHLLPEAVADTGTIEYEKL